MYTEGSMADKSVVDSQHKQRVAFHLVHTDPKTLLISHTMVFVISLPGAKAIGE
jgi:hypothetical protein